MAKRVTVFVPGTIYWAKIVGEKALVTNYDGDGREWSFELEPEDTSFLKEHRLLDRLKDPQAYPQRLRERGEDEKAEKAEKDAEGRSDYLLLRKPEFTKDGDKNEPIRIYNSDNEAWDDRLLGNGTKVIAKLQIVDWGVGKKKSIYTQALRVEDLVPYESNEFGGYDGKNDKPAKTKAKASNKKAATGKTILEELDELDDEMPAFD